MRHPRDNRGRLTVEALIRTQVLDSFMEPRFQRNAHPFSTKTDQQAHDAEGVTGKVFRFAIVFGVLMQGLYCGHSGGLLADLDPVAGHHESSVDFEQRETLDEQLGPYG